MTFSRAAFAVLDMAPVPPPLRAFSARRIGYVLLMLLALLSKDALAQTSRQVAVVTFEPGEYSKVITVVPGVPHDFGLRAPGLICNWPSIDKLRQQVPLVTVADLNTLEQNTAAIGGVLFAVGVLGRKTREVNMPFIPDVLLTNQVLDPLSQSDRSVVFARDCVEFEEARSALLQIRQVIRARLGLPLVPTEPARVERLERPATLQAPTGAGSPATIR